MLDTVKTLDFGLNLRASHY